MPKTNNNNTPITVAGVQFSPDEINQLKESGSAQSKNLKSGTSGVSEVKPLGPVIREDSVTDPSSLASGYAGPAPDVSIRTRKVTRPVTRDEAGKPLNQAAVRAPNINEYNKRDAKFKLDQLIEAEALKAEREAQSPDKMHAEIQFLTRTVKKLQREVSSLKKGKN